MTEPSPRTCAVVRPAGEGRVPAGMPHQPVNLSAGEPCVAVARTDPDEQEHVVLLDDRGRRREG